jgi:hypothetical protein
VIHQVKRYPANEQWLAISSDAYNQLTHDGQAKLRADCRRDGIGLLRVSAGARVTILETTTPKSTPYGLPDFLALYARENDIRRKL